MSTSLELNFTNKLISYDTSRQENAVTNTHYHYNDEPSKNFKELIVEIQKQHIQSLEKYKDTPEMQKLLVQEHNHILNKIETHKSFDYPIHHDQKSSYSTNDLLKAMGVGGVLVAGGFLLNQQTSQLSGENSTDNFDNHDQMS